MSDVVSPERPADVSAPAAIAMALELIVIPVSDVDRAIGFYRQAGWRFDIEASDGDGYRIVQFTPPGSGTSVIFGAGVTDAAAGSVRGLHLIVSDVVAARDDLLRRGIAVGPLFHDDSGIFHRAGPAGRAPGPNPERRSYASYAAFADPDGNEWVMQEITARLGADLVPGDPRFAPRIVAAALAMAQRDDGDH